MVIRYKWLLDINDFSASISLGTHGAHWRDWHMIGCAFVAIVNYFALKWINNKKYKHAVIDILNASAFIFGVCSIQNLYLVLTTNKYKNTMWFHSLFCGYCASSSLLVAQNSDK